MADLKQIQDGDDATASRRRFLNLPILASMAALIVLDVMARSQFTVTPLFVFVVVWAAWTEGFLYATVLGLILTGVHFGDALAIGIPSNVSPQIVNTTIRAATFVALAFATSKLAWYVHMMQRRIAELESRLPVCNRCGLIRGPDGVWVPLGKSGKEGKRQEILCPECERKHYEI
jgi:uncharacterized membrane protein